MTLYKSSVLLCHGDDDSCPVCRFLSGDHSEEILLAVIKVLDEKLGEEEIHTRRYLKALLEKESK